MLFIGILPIVVSFFVSNLVPNINFADSIH